MKYLISLIFVCALMIQNGWSKSKNHYASSNIESALLSNAEAVIRLDSTYLSITASGYVLKSKKVITILKESGRRWGRFVEMYKESTKISDIKGKLYNADGEEISSLKKNELRDVSTFGNSFIFHNDTRLKIYDFDQRVYPYTVEFEHTIKSTENLFLPSWNIQSSTNLSVEKSVFVLSYPKNEQVKWRENNLPAQYTFNQNDKGNLQELKWEIENVLAYKQALLLENKTNDVSVDFVKESIVLGAYSGTSSSWNTFGNFFYTINKDRDELPDAMVAKIKMMTDTCANAKDKVAVLYQYLQRNTRYVANEYGLAGWQTFPASEVNKLGYGDCKGLANYMKAMLKAINIPSHLVLVSAGENSFVKMDEQFVRSAFNHMILCVLLDKDTIWVESTSSTNPIGYLGSFTQGRNVLLLTENGGIVAQTPYYDKNSSYLNRKIEIWIEPNADNHKLTWNTVYSGVLQDDLVSLYKIGAQSRIKNYQSMIMPYKVFNIANFETKFNEDPYTVPFLNEKIEMSAKQLTEHIGDQLLVHIPVKESLMSKIYQKEKRTVPFEFVIDKKHKYQFVINIPQGYKIQNIPTVASISKPFGKFEINPTEENNTLLIDVVFEQNAGIYDAKHYDAYNEMYQFVEEHFNSIQFMLKK